MSYPNTGTAPMHSGRPLVHVRTPCYERPDFLRRALQSLIAQTWDNWVCDVFDDSQSDLCRQVVEDLGDSRIQYRKNAPRKFASANIDQCFSKANPHNAQYFCLLEDDNYFLPGFMEKNINLLQDWGGKVVLRNQIMECKSGTDEAYLSDIRLMSKTFDEGVLSAEKIRLSLLAGIGISHGGLFWAHDCKTDFEVHAPVNATILETARTYLLEDDVWCALEPEAVWAQNGENTTRDLGADYFARLGRIKRTLQNERNMAALRRAAWKAASGDAQADFLQSRLFRYDAARRARGLLSSWISIRAGKLLPIKERGRLLLRSLLVNTAFQAEPGVRQVIAKTDVFRSEKQGSKSGASDVRS